ncbi:hypothetical protein ACHAXN_010208 [Cyclotella atomus]
MLSFVLAASCPGRFHTSSSPRLACRHRLRPKRTATTDNAADGNVIDTKDFYIEMVSTKARALDVKVFRGLSKSAAEYISEQHEMGNEISETIAIDHLMKNYNDNGHYIVESYNNLLLPHEPEDYFIALYNGTDSMYGASMARQNGIAGLVRTQLCHRPPSVLVLPSTVPISSTHMYVSNMRVGDNMQRRGIGMALLSYIKDYVSSLDEDKNIPLVLSVDSDNIGAIRLYEKFGFEYLERNNEWGTMILI